MTNISHNPYVGPRPFNQAEGDRFFGRDIEAQNLFSLVVSERLVLFYAQSGAGKSSLLNARLIPQLAQEYFMVMPIGRVGGELPAGLSQVDNIFVFNLLLSLDQSQVDPRRFARMTLSHFLANFAADGHHFYYDDAPAEAEAEIYEEPAHILIIDQFEEIVTTHHDRWPERDPFFRQLEQAITDDPLLWVLLTMREDHVPALDPYASLLPDKLRIRFHMQRMGYENALAAIKKPVEQAGRPFAPGVAESLANNLRQIRTRAEGEAATRLGQFVEPVQLQVVCYQLWENLKDRPAAAITHQDLQELGDVDTALAQFYEQAVARTLAETEESEISLRDWFNRQLITEAGTRGVVYQGAAQTGGLDNHTVALLANQFLLRAEIRAGGTWYELVHDRFIEPILQANRAWRERQSELVRAALAWDEAGREKGQLYLGQQLEDALASLGPRQPQPLVAEFLDACQKENQIWLDKEVARQRELRLWRWGATILFIFLLIVIAATIFAFLQRQQAQAQAAAARAAEQTAETRREEAEAAREQALAAQQEAEHSALVARSGQLAAQAQTALIENLPQRSLLLAVEAISITLQTEDLRVPAAEEVLWQTLVKTGGRSLGSHDDKVTAVTVSPDNRWLVTSGGMTANLWDLTNLDVAPVVLAAQEATISTVIISPDSQWLALVDGATIQLWDLTDLTVPPVTLRSHKDVITALVISPDNRWLITGSEDRTARLWDLTNLETSPIILPVQDKPIADIVISPDNRWLVTTGSFDTTARVWDLTDLEAEPTLLSSESYPIEAIAITPDNRWLVGGSDDTYMWDLTASTLPSTPLVLPSQSFVNAVAVSADNRWLVTGYQDNSVDVWDLSNREGGRPRPVASLGGHSGAITRAYISDDSRWLATGSTDNTVRLWDLTNLDANPIILRGHDGVISAITISPDNRWLVTGSEDRTARLWDLTAPNPAVTAPIILPGSEDVPVRNVVISANNQWLVMAQDDATVRLWDLRTADGSLSKSPDLTTLIESGHTGTITALAISADNRRLVTAGDDATVHLWDLQNMPNLADSPIIPTGHEAAIRALAISSDNRWLASGSDDTNVRLWDLEGGIVAETTATVFTDHEGSISTIVFSPDSRRLATAGRDGLIRLRDLQQPNDDSVTLPGHEAPIKTLAISPDNQWLASGDDNGVVYLWGLQHVAETAVAPIILSGHEDSISAMTISPDSHWLVTGSTDATARLWDLTAAYPAAVSKILPGHSSSILSVAVSADSRWLVTGSFDETARLWDLTNPDPATTAIVLRGHEGAIFTTAISPDGQWLVTGSSDATARLWTLQLEDLVKLACRAAGRNFTSDEWVQYFPRETYRRTCVDKISQ